MEIYDELVFGDCKNSEDFIRASSSFQTDEESESVAGVLVDGSGTSTFLLLNKTKQQIFTCSSLHSPEIHVTSKCQFRKEVGRNGGTFRDSIQVPSPAVFLLHNY